MSAWLSRKFQVISFLACLAVVWIHAFNLPPGFIQADSAMQAGWGALDFIEFLVSASLAGFAVPLFFLISGFLLCRNWRGEWSDWLGKIRVRLRSLVLPYLLWNSLALALVLAVLAIPDHGDAIAGQFRRTGPLDYALSYLRQPMAYQLWYLRDLFIAVLFLPLWWRLMRRPALAWTAIGLMAALACAGLELRVVDPSGFCFFLLGCRLGFQPSLAEWRIPARAWLGIAALYLGLALLRTVLAGSPDHGLALTLLRFPVVVAGVATVWFGYDWLADPARQANFRLRHLLMPVYLAHDPALALLNNAALVCLGESVWLRAGLYLLLPLALVSAIALADRWFRHRLPGLRSFLMGGR